MAFSTTEKRCFLRDIREYTQISLRIRCSPAVEKNYVCPWNHSLNTVSFYPGGAGQKSGTAWAIACAAMGVIADPNGAMGSE